MQTEIECLLTFFSQKGSFVSRAAVDGRGRVDVLQLLHPSVVWSDCSDTLGAGAVLMSL